jgi:hypothetical protein
MDWISVTTITSWLLKRLKQSATVISPLKHSEKSFELFVGTKVSFFEFFPLFCNRNWFDKNFLQQHWWLLLTLESGPKKLWWGPASDSTWCTLKLLAKKISWHKTSSKFIFQLTIKCSNYSNKALQFSICIIKWWYSQWYRPQMVAQYLF